MATKATQPTFTITSSWLHAVALRAPLKRLTASNRYMSERCNRQDFVKAYVKAIKLGWNENFCRFWAISLSISRASIFSREFIKAKMTGGVELCRA